MSDLFYRVPRMTALAVLTIAALGIIAMDSLGRQEQPPFTNILAFIVTQQPGADAARVEAQVTEPIEQRLGEIAEIERLRSISRSGLSMVIVELKSTLPPDEVTEAWSRIRDALSDVAAELPGDAGAPVFDDTRVGAYTAITALVARDPATPVSVVARYAEDLRDSLLRAPGVKQVRLFGRVEEEITVEVDPAELAQFGWSAARVARAIAEADPSVGAGHAVGRTGDIVVEVTGAIDSISRVRGIVLAVSEAGGEVRVGDIARVTRGERTPASEIALADGRRAVLVAVMMQDGRQVGRFADDIAARMDAFETGLPGGLEHLRLFDQSVYSAERLSDLGNRLLAGFAMVVLVLCVTLGLRSALVVAVALPLVTLATLATLALLRISLDQMSVAGLIVALGMLVDASIVMVDEIRKRVDAPGADGREVGAAVRRLLPPLFAATATTVLAFLPMALMPGPPGDFLGPIALVVITMLVWSLVVACTLTPALAGWLLRAEGAGGGGLLHRGLRLRRLERVFRAVLTAALARPARTVILGLALPAAGGALALTLVEQFFPPVDRNQFHIEVEAAAGSGIEATAETVRRIDAVLAREPLVASRIWTIGRSAPPFYYNMLDFRERLPGFASGLITSVSPEATAELIPRLQARFDAELLDVRVVVRELIQGPPVIAPVELRLTGPDLETLKALGRTALPLVADLPSISHARASIGSGPPKLQFRLDEHKVLSAGLTLDEVARELRAALDGVVGASVIEGVERLPIRVRMETPGAGEPDLLRSLTLVSPGTGRAVSIAALGEMTVVPATRQITRHEGERTNTLELFPRAGVLPRTVVDGALAELERAGFVLPHGYRIEIGGDTDIRALTIENMARPIPVLLVLAAAVFVVAFNSFRLAAVSLLACALFGGLSMLAVAAFGYPLGLAVVVGMIGSIGVSINDTIVVLTALQKDSASAADDVGAMVETVIGSGRHVLSTTLTTVVGFLPLALTGGGLWPSFSVAIVGGVTLSTVITLFLAPALFRLVYAAPPARAPAPSAPAAR